MMIDNPLDFTAASRRAVGWAWGINAGMLGIEIAAAILIGSVALFADSMDFLEDSILLGLAFLALGWSQSGQARAALVLAAAMAIPGLAALVAAIDKMLSLVPPEPMTMGVVGALALAANFASAVLLVRSRNDSTVLNAAWLSARNDVVCNIAVIVAAVLVSRWASAWPDILAGLGIVAINGSSAVKIARSAWHDLKAA